MVQYKLKGLKDKNVLITGASGGIGKEIAKQFADNGANIGVHYNENKDSAYDIIASLESKAELFQGDLTNYDTRTNLINDFVDKMGSIDILVNNAGIVKEYKSFLELSEEIWDKVYTVNIKAPFFLSRNAFKYMSKQNYGRIINISSVNVKYGGSGNSLHYASSKSALENLTIGLAKEGSKYNILVNTIRSGIINTPMRFKIDGYSDEKYQRRINMVPLKRAGKVSDVASMVTYLSSDLGSYITGEIFTIAGGD